MLQNRKSNLAESPAMMSAIEGGYHGGVGADLRAARERLGWGLPAISQRLRIRLPYLEAIEDGRIEELPGNAYAVGFVRTYATALGLDPDEISRRFRAEAANVNRKTELTFPAPVPERGVPAGAVVLLGVVVVVLAYAGWYRFSGDRRPPLELVQAVPDRLAPLAPQPTPAPVVTAPAASVAARPPSAVTPPTAVVARPPVAGQAPAPVVAASEPSVPKPVIPTPILVPVPPVPASTQTAAAPTPALPPQPDGTRIVLRAKAEAWVQVSDRQGNVVFNRTMRPGETWPVPAKPGLVMITGNAGGTELLVDGVLSPSLGADGAVRRNLPLDADQVKDGKLAASPPPAPAPVPAQAAASRPPAPKQP